MNPKNLPRAACVFVIRDGRLLSVARKHDARLPGLPGGKVEEGETDTQAAARECFEETGIVVGGLRHLYSAEDGHGYWCTTFAAHQFSGEPRDMGQGHVEWILPEELLRGQFVDYNRAVLAAWRKMTTGA